MKKAAASLLVLMMMASVAVADGRGQGGPGAPQRGAGGGFDGPRDGGGNVQVAADGTVYVSRIAVDNTAGTISTQVTAVRSSGSVAFTVNLAGHRHLFLSGTNLISVSETATSGVVSTTLTGISPATGAASWTRNLAGRVTSLEAFSGGTYAIVVAPSATAGAAPTRSLVAIGNDGAVLWTVTLP